MKDFDEMLGKLEANRKELGEALSAVKRAKDAKREIQVEMGQFCSVKVGDIKKVPHGIIRVEEVRYEGYPHIERHYWAIGGRLVEPGPGWVIDDRAGAWVTRHGVVIS